MIDVEFFQNQIKCHKKKKLVKMSRKGKFIFNCLCNKKIKFVEHIKKLNYINPLNRIF